MSADSKPTLALSVFAVSLDGAEIGRPGETYLFCTRTGAVVCVSRDDFEQINRGGPLPAPITSALLEAGFLVDEATDEFAQLISENREHEKCSRVLRLVFQPTAFCQMGCGYCGQSHAAETASPARIDEFARFVDSRLQSGAYDVLELGLFGAEPLAGYRQIRMLAKTLQPVLERHRCRLVSKMVSNGLLATRERVEALRDAIGLRKLEVTLDGPPEIHEISRPLLNARGRNFSRILQNIEDISRIDDAQLTIRVNVSRLNAAHVTALLDILLASKVKRSACQIYFAPLHSWGNDAHELSLAPEHFAILDVGWKAFLINRGWHVGALPGRRKSTCIATTREGWVVDHNGKMFDCTEKPLVQSYINHAAGSVDDATPNDPIAKRRYGDFLSSDAARSCRTCFALPVCGGRCPKEWEEGRAPCPPFKAAPDLYFKLALASADACRGAAQ